MSKFGGKKKPSVGYNKSTRKIVETVGSSMSKGLFKPTRKGFFQAVIITVLSILLLVSIGYYSR